MKGITEYWLGNLPRVAQDGYATSAFTHSRVEFEAVKVVSLMCKVPGAEERALRVEVFRRRSLQKPTKAPACWKHGKLLPREATDSPRAIFVGERRCRRVAIPSCHVHG